MKSILATGALAALTLVTAVSLPVPAAHAGTLTVNTANDEDVDNGVCSLREAMQAAFNSGHYNGCTHTTGGTSPPHVINFSGNFTIAVALEEDTFADVVNEVTVNDTGQSIIIDGDDADSRAFNVDPDGHLTLLDLTVQNFNVSGSGGAVENSGSLTATDVIFENNSAGSGGAIDSGGDLILTDVEFMDNEATSGDGGAINFHSGSASMTVTGIIPGAALFQSNSATAGNGGAIAVSGLGDPMQGRSVVITNTIFAMNSADGGGGQPGGGAIHAATTHSDAFFSIVASEFLMNSADNGGGGAILLTNNSRIAYADPTLPMVGGIFASNFVGNSAGDSGTDGIGGAIFSRGELTVVSSSFLDNSSDAAGAIGQGVLGAGLDCGSTNGQLTVANGTFSANTAADDGGAVALIRDSSNCKAQIINSTFSDNEATSGSGGAIFNNNSDADAFEVANSILANNTAGGNGGNCGGEEIDDQGGNFQFNPNAGCGTIPTGDPMLDAPPFLNPCPSGPCPNLLVLTMALQQDSAALGAGVPGFCTDGPILNVDARGALRPDGDPFCDSGAYESNLLADQPVANLVFMPPSHDFGPVQEGDSQSFNVELQNIGDADATDLNLTDPSVPFSQTNDCPPTLSKEGGTCTVTVVFAPTVAGIFDDTVEASAVDGGGGGNVTATLALDGEGVTQPVANLVFMPASHDFGAVQVNDFATMDVFLENNGTAEATNLMLTGPALPFSQINNCPATLQPQGQCTVTVQFEPTVAGIFDDTVEASAVDGGGGGNVTATLMLDGEGVTQPVANLVFMPSSHDFGPVQEGGSASVNVTLQNNGTADATNLMLTGPALPFSQTNDCQSTLPKEGGTCTVTVVFEPTVAGIFDDTVEASADGGVTATLTLEGEGAVANLVFMPASHDFGAVQVNDFATMDVFLENNGTAEATNLMLTGPALPFSQINNCPATLQPQGQCTVTVQFEPTVAGNFSDSVEASAAGGVSATLTLDGEGVTQPVANLVFMPASHDFGAVQVNDFATMDVILENNGTAEATNLMLTDPSAPFSQTHDCPPSLPMAGTCTVTVVFAPTMVDTFSDTVEATADGGVTATLILDGEGVTQPTANLVFTPASHDFGPVQVNDSQSVDVTLQNTGGAAAENLSLTDPSAPFSQTHDCPPSLPMAGTCTVTVVFAPTVVDTFSDIVEATADGGVNATLTLDGEGEPGPGGVPTPEALDVDGTPIASDGNGVFEPGEQVEVAPAWLNNNSAPLSVTGAASDFTGPSGATYGLVTDAADYGTLDPGASASCLDTGFCYAVEVDDPAVRPTLHWDATVLETLSDPDATTKTWTLHIGKSFADVPPTALFYRFVETMVHHGMAIDCGGGNFCPDLPETRDMMAMAVLTALEGGGYQPEDCVDGAEVFADVPFDDPFCPWIEELFDRGVILGCGGGNYCPGSPVTRAQMAVFLLKTLQGASYTPPACTGLFDDVACPSPFADWIEDLFGRGITAGCGTSPLRYCPGDSITRGQCAAFQSKSFDLTLYGP